LIYLYSTKNFSITIILKSNTAPRNLSAISVVEKLTRVYLASKGVPWIHFVQSRNQTPDF